MTKTNLAITVAVTLLCVVVLAVGFAAPTLKADAFSSVVSPLILGTASLILSLGARNASISERIRTTARALLDAKASTCAPRVDSLHKQLRIFRMRFSFNQTAMLLQIVALPLFMAMYVLSSTDQMWLASRVFYFGIGLAILGFALTLLEVSFGWGTLALEARFAEEQAVTPVASERLLLKTLDILIFCQNQYDSIRFSHAPRVSREVDAKMYYGRFWNHQLTQFEFYLKGLVDPDTFRFWMECRRQEFIANEELGTVSFQDGWAQCKDLLNNTQFKTFMMLVFQESVEAGITFVQPKVIARGL
jgi:hypothetical protein